MSLSPNVFTHLLIFQFSSGAVNKLTRHGASYLAETLRLTADVDSRRRLRSPSIRRRWSYRPHDAPRWVIEPSG